MRALIKAPRSGENVAQFVRVPAWVFVSSALALPLFLPSLSQAADIYRWVDEQGRTHVADVVPERYKGVAVRVPKAVQPSEVQRAEAADRAAKDRARLSEIESGRQTQTQASAAPSAAPGAAPRRAENSSGSECDRLWQEYHESQACFAPFHGPYGIKAEAYAKCKEVGNPSLKCGPAKVIAP